LAGQLWHFPAAQLCPVPQAFAQLPQLAGSPAVSTHEVTPAAVHFPPAQLSPEAQAVPQAPQLAGSPAVLTQVELAPPSQEM
jgi:hypothetical protein